MSQITIYLPTELEERVRHAARRAHKSVSAFLAELAAAQLEPTRWPKSFRDVLGSWEGDFPIPDDPPPDEPDSL